MDVETIEIETAEESDVEVEDIVRFIEYCIPGALSLVKCEQSPDRVVQLRDLYKDPGI